MIQRYWYHIASLVVILLISILLVSHLRPTPPEHGFKQVQVTRTPGYMPGGSKCSSRSAEDVDLCNYEREQYLLQSNDLVQQTRAADSATAQAFLAEKVAWMVLVGTLGGFWTLAAAAAAAIYARSAAMAANLSLSHATDTTEDEMRPWLQLDVAPDLFELEREQALAAFEITLSNLGKLPARVVYAEGQIFNFDPELVEVREYFASADFCKSQIRTILPHGKVKLLGTTPSLARDKIVISDTDGQAQVHTVLAVKVVYQWGNRREGRTCQAYEMFHGKPNHDGTQRIPIDPEGDTCEKFKVKQMGCDNIY
ncbi:MAG TPA: hypothetical protein VE053_08960 [Allosphingosinicella sp.]|nr:hypothetical protein [Allosphingosinicella sp.]